MEFVTWFLSKTSEVLTTTSATNWEYAFYGIQVGMISLFVCPPGLIQNLVLKQFELQCT